jgi:hypothetical protein
MSRMTAEGRSETNAKVSVSVSPFGKIASLSPLPWFRMQPFGHHW